MTDWLGQGSAQVALRLEVGAERRLHCCVTPVRALPSLGRASRPVCSCPAQGGGAGKGGSPAESLRVYLCVSAGGRAAKTPIRAS